MVRKLKFFLKLVFIAFTPPMFNFKRLEKAVMEAIKLHPEEVLFKEYLAEMYFGFGKTNEARCLWEEVLKVNPVPKNIFEFGKVLYSLGEFELAMKEFRKLPQTMFDSYDVGKYWGLLNMQTGNYQETLTTLSKFMNTARAKKDASFFRALGFSAYQMRDLDQSIGFLTEAKKYSPEDPEISHSLEIAKIEKEKVFPKVHSSPRQP